jgi:adenylate cyclase
MGGRVERRLAAVLAADVAGYSRLMGADEHGTLEALKAHRREVIDPTIADHTGRIVKTTGDGMLVEFASAVDAVTCAMAVQEKIAQRNSRFTPAIILRIGINIGDIIIDDGDIFGDGVNIAARVESECEPGGVCLSASAYEQVRGKTAFLFDDLGERRLKNIARPVRLYAARSAGERAVSSTQGRKPLSLPDKPSIAVLPFQNMSAESEQEYFADGMAEEVITALSRNKQLFVIARSSTFTFKGRAVDIREVAEALGVRYVLEGSVRKSGNRIRITGQLIDAASGVHLWADKFDGSLEDVFDLQDHVAASVVGAIGSSVAAAEMDRAGRKPTENLDAYDYFLRGQAAHWQFTRDGTSEAIRLYEQALSLDPHFATALVALASAISMRGISGWSADPASDLSRAAACARNAIRMAPQDPLVLARSAAVFINARDIELADSLAEQANRLDPNDIYALLWGGFAKLFLGNHRAAMDRFRRALRQSPVDPRALYAQTGLAFACFFLGDYDRGCEYAVEAVRDHPEVLIGLRAAMACHAYAGEVDAAREFYQRLALLAPAERVSDLRKRNAYRREEDYRKLEDAYRLAGMPE